MILFKDNHDLKKRTVYIIPKRYCIGNVPHKNDDGNVQQILL